LNFITKYTNLGCDYKCHSMTFRNPFFRMPDKELEKHVFVT
jgi:hypothetical protein